MARRAALMSGALTSGELMVAQRVAVVDVGLEGAHVARHAGGACAARQGRARRRLLHSRSWAAGNSRGVERQRARRNAWTGPDKHRTRFGCACGERGCGEGWRRGRGARTVEVRLRLGALEQAAALAAAHASRASDGQQHACAERTRAPNARRINRSKRGGRWAHVPQAQGNETRGPFQRAFQRALRHPTSPYPNKGAPGRPAMVSVDTRVKR